MSRAGRLLLTVVAVLAWAPAAHAATPTVSDGHNSSDLKALGSESRNSVTGDIVIGDPGPERAPRLIVRTVKDLTVTLDSEADSLTADVGSVDAPVTQTGPLTYTVDVPDARTLPTFLRLEIHSTEGDWVTRANWEVELADAPVPRFSTVWTAPVSPALLSYTEGPRGGPIVIADGFGLNAPTLRAAPGAVVTVTLSGWVNEFKAHSGSRELTTAKLDDTTYTVTLPGDLALPARFSVRFDYSSKSFQGEAGYTANLEALPLVTTTFADPPAPVFDSPATVSALKLRGRRLSVTVACASACPGVLTLKTPSVRVARLTFAGPGRYTATISRPAQRHLKRHRTKRLRAVLTTRGQTSKASSLALR